MSDRRHRFYLKESCKFCAQLLEELIKTPFVKEFAVISVDAAPGRPRPRLPPELTTVPTFFIVGESTQRKGLFQCMSWLQEQKLMGSKRPFMGATTTATTSSTDYHSMKVPAPTPGRAPPVGGGPMATTDDGPAGLAFGGGYSQLDEAHVDLKANVSRSENLAGIYDEGLFVPESRTSNMMAGASPGVGGPGVPAPAHAPSSKQDARRKEFDDDMARKLRERGDIAPGPRRT
jgi:hypothetical protein